MTFVAVLRTRVTMYSAATAVLLGAFAVLLLCELLFNPTPQLGHEITIGLMLVAVVAAVSFLFLGDRGGPWPALLLAAAHITPGVLFLTVLHLPLSVIGVILQMPVIALYLGGFLAPWLARTAEFVVMLVLVVIVIADPSEVVGELGGGRNLPSMLIFTWLCLEAGIFVQKKFKHEAHFDPLTGLYNRRGFIDHADTERARADRNGDALSLALIDLDHFKVINDTQGHAAGDRALKELARSWREAARDSDILARVGGDEFIFLLPGTGIDGAEAFLARLSVDAVHPWSWGATEWRQGELISTAITRADEAMYQQKKGRVGVQAAT